MRCRVGTDAYRDQPAVRGSAVVTLKPAMNSGMGR